MVKQSIYFLFYYSIIEVAGLTTVGNVLPQVKIGILLFLLNATKRTKRIPFVGCRIFDSHSRLLLHLLIFMFYFLTSSECIQCTNILQPAFPQRKIVLLLNIFQLHAFS